MEGPFYRVRARAKLRPGNHARVAEWQTQGTQKTRGLSLAPRFILRHCSSLATSNIISRNPPAKSAAKWSAATAAVSHLVDKLSREASEIRKES